MVQRKPKTQNTSCSCHNLFLADSINLFLFYVKVSQEGGNILVHCVAGVSRSVSLCLAYLLKYHKMSLKEAYEYVERRRPCIKPNNSFFKQLIDFEIENRGNPSISMILDESTQSYIPDIYERKFSNKLCCQMKVCQKRHCGTHWFRFLSVFFFLNFTSLFLLSFFFFYIVEKCSFCVHQVFLNFIMYFCACLCFFVFFFLHFTLQILLAENCE